VSVRLPEVRQALLREVSTLQRWVGTAEDEVAFGDAVEEVHHLLDPSHGGEPGDLLLTHAEVVLSLRLWRALDRAPWPVEPEQRKTDPVWVEVAQHAAEFLEGTGEAEDLRA